ncbi:hypothetical protein Tco_0642386 [Tanacetum coccineum]
MSNINNNLQTQTSNALHNAFMEVGGKDRPPMLAPEDSSETSTEGYMENSKNVSQYIRNQLDAEAIQIILIGIDNDIYSIVDVCPNACEMWKAIKRLKQDIKKQHQNEVNEIRAERLARTTNLLALVAQQQLIYYPQINLTHYTQNSSTRLQQATTTNRGKAIINSSQPTYDQEPAMVAKNDEMSNEKEIDKVMVLISLSFKKIYKPTNNNLKTSSNTNRENQDNNTRISRGSRYDNQRVVNVVEAMENVVDWRDDIDDEHKDQELEELYLYMAQIQEVTPDAAKNYGPIFDAEPLQKVQNDDDNYNVFANDREHPEQPKFVNDIKPNEQGDDYITTLSLDMSNKRGEAEQDDDDNLAKEHNFLASLIEKLKCEIDDNKNHNKFLESSNNNLVDKLKGEIKDFKNKNKSLESSNTHFEESNTELAKNDQLMFKDLKKFQAEHDRYHDVNYASKVEIDCAKAKGELISYKMSSEKSFNEYTRRINDLNQMISKLKKELIAHQETISIMSQEKEAQKKFYKTREDKEIEKVIALESKVKVLDGIIYKTSQSVQTMNMLNRNCKTSFVKLEFLKKAQRVNPRLYDIACHNDNLALKLAPKSDETIRLAQESLTKLSDLIKPFDYKNLNNLYDLFVPQRENLLNKDIFQKGQKKVIDL